MDFFIAFFSFLLSIGVLVSIHEWGHFWVAKKLGIKVLRFSVGFGPILKSWHFGETQYTLCAIPLGGFVNMLDENEGDVAAEEKHRAFNQQNVYKRIAVVIAGPAVNFIFAIMAWMLVFLIGTVGIKPLVGDVKTGGIAEKVGLATGDKLLAVNGEKTQTIGQFSSKFIQSLNAETLQLTVISNAETPKIIKLPSTADFFNNEQSIEHYLGFKFALPKIAPIINQVRPDSPAHLAGLMIDDKIIKANDKNIDSWSAFVTVIENNPQQAIKLHIERNHQPISLVITPENQAGVGKIGVGVARPKNYLNNWRVVVEKDLIDAFLAANIKVYQLTKLNLWVIKKMLLGQISLKHISGPIKIADFAGKSAQVGFSAFLSFLALISISLGLLNLLPIPFLDGGYLLFYLIEIIKGSPVNKNFTQILLKIGLVLILLLTSIALYNDLSYLFK